MKTQTLTHLALFIALGSQLTACLIKRGEDIVDDGSGNGVPTPGSDDGTGSGGNSNPTLTIADLATQESHAGAASESYASACVTSTELSSMNSGTSHSYYDILSFGTNGTWDYERLWYEGTNCYFSAGDANSNSIPDGDSNVEIDMGGTASIAQFVSGSKFVVQFNNTHGTNLRLTHILFKNWYTGACTNGPSFTYTSETAETRSLNGINCTPWGQFPSTASADDGKIFNVIEKVSATEIKLGAFPSNQRGPGVNKSLGNVDTTVTPTITFTRYTY